MDDVRWINTDTTANRITRALSRPLTEPDAWSRGWDTATRKPVIATFVDGTHSRVRVKDSMSLDELLASIR